jgi:hypothetical protein
MFYAFRKSFNFLNYVDLAVVIAEQEIELFLSESKIIQVIWSTRHVFYIKDYIVLFSCLGAGESTEVNLFS